MKLGRILALALSAAPVAGEASAQSLVNANPNGVADAFGRVIAYQLGQAGAPGQFVDEDSYSLFCNGTIPTTPVTVTNNRGVHSVSIEIVNLLSRGTTAPRTKQAIQDFLRRGDLVYMETDIKHGADAHVLSAIYKQMTGDVPLYLKTYGTGVGKRPTILVDERANFEKIVRQYPTFFAQSQAHYSMTDQNSWSGCGPRKP